MPIINKGVLVGIRSEDYRAGAGSPIPYEVRNESGDWRPYLPPGEWQKNHKDDFMACVTFSALNSLECQHIFLGKGPLNLSDRFTAAMSGTTQTGNWLYKVADSIRRDGAVAESDWPMAQDMTWEQYYASIPPEVQAQGKKFLEKYRVDSEFIGLSVESLKKHLKHAPIQIVIPGHAVLGVFSEADIQHYFDSYEPWLKTTPFAGVVQSAMKYVLTPKVVNEMPSLPLGEWVIRALQAFEGYKDPVGAQYWGKRLASEGFTALVEYIKARVPDKKASLDSVGQPPQS